jgi:hypothetical protein
MSLIEIPGYRILRQLGRGGMATVYLAMQESVQREVALKVMSPALLTDPDFSERFLREARIAARLHHRHVVGIYDVARHGDYNTIAMEYLGGGPVLTHDGPKRPLGFVLRVTREIALALNYAHTKGFVHRDVKPDNILLREDGSSALTDFGIARAVDSAMRMTRTGAVIGTPHYMSPEQARGKAVDGRSDLYSLGVVLYEMLVGRVPYHAEDSLAVGIMHISEPVPVLPERFLTLQPLLARMLAKKPENRFQSGRELADAIERCEREIAAGEHPELTYADADEGEARNGDMHFTDIDGLRARDAQPSDVFQHRADPALGRLEDMSDTGGYRAARRASARRSAKRSRRRGWIASAAIALACAALAIAAWHWQDRLRTLLVPNTQLNDTLARAQKALADGRLLGEGGARELFQSVRAQDADNDLARQGLAQVGVRLLAEARAALHKNDFVAARGDLDAANDILGGGSQVEEVKKALDAAQARGAQVENLLARADAALTAQRLLGADGAAALYRQILDADADNAVARHGLDKAAQAQAQLAREAIAQGDAGLAERRIAELAELSPNHAAIPDLRAELARRRADDEQTQKQAQNQRIADAEQALTQGRLDQAHTLFAAALKSEPNDARVQAGLRKLGIAWAAQAGKLIAAKNLTDAERVLRQAETLAADAAEVRAARAHLRDALEAAAIEQRQMREPSLADQARIEEMLGDADRAMTAGNLMDPGGAYDKYRAVLGIDGNNTRALEGLKRIAPRARSLFDSELAAGKPYAAHGYLDAIADTDPGNPALIGLRARLADAYFDQADRYVGEGRRGDALRAFNAARQLSPSSPRSAALEAKIESLPAGGG